MESFLWAYAAVLASIIIVYGYLDACDQKYWDAERDKMLRDL